MNKNYQLTIVNRTEGKQAETSHLMTGGTALRLPAQPGAQYVLTDTATGRAPQQLHTRRRGKDLLIQVEDYRPDDSVDLVLENFYEREPGTFTGLAEDGESYRFIPNTAEAQHQMATMAEGDRYTQVLGGAAFTPPPVFVAAAAPLVAAAGGLGLGAAAAAVGALGLAAAAGGGGGSGSGSGGGGTPQPAVSLEAGLKPSDDTGTSNSDKLTNKTQPTIEGKTAPGNKVFVTLDNGTEQEVPVDPKDGSWTWTAPNALAPEEHTIKVKAQDPKGATNEQTLKVTVDTSPLGMEISHPASLAPALADGKLNIAELGEAVPVTLRLSEPPNRDLTVDDLSVTGGSIKPGSFQKISATEYAVSVLPPATPNSDNGRIDVSLKTSLSPALTDAAGNPLGTVAPKVFHYDNKPPTVVITSNQEALDTQKRDGFLNSAESANGVAFTLTLDSVPSRDLSVADLVLTDGQSLQVSDLTRNSEKVYTLLAKPLANTASGQLQLKLQPATTLAVLSDLAGNPLAVTAGPVVNFDTRAISATVISNQAALDAPPKKTASSTARNRPMA